MFKTYTNIIAHEEIKLFHVYTYENALLLFLTNIIYIKFYFDESVAL